MNNNKAFTLVEMLAVVIIIMIIFGLYKGSHNKGMDVRRNEIARARLFELSTAARLYNETNPEHKIMGTFGASGDNDYLDPCYLFEGYGETANPQLKYEDIANFALLPRTWGYTRSNIATNCSAANFRAKYNYDFYLCNPDFQGVQPQNVGCDNDTLAVLVSPATGVGEAYNGHKAYIRRDGTLDTREYGE